jgi:hypothetical protein
LTTVDGVLCDNCRIRLYPTEKTTNHTKIHQVEGE